MNEIFISYSRKDKEFAAKLDGRLREDGIDPWVDWEDIALSADWWEEIQRGIEAAHTFVFIISPDSVASKVCNQEIDHATEHNKRIIPVVCRDAADVPLTLTHLNWIFFRDTDDFETAFNNLMITINTDLEWVGAHTRLTVRAVEWEQQGKDDSFVLRGSDLRNAEPMLEETDKEPKLTPLQNAFIVASQQSAIRRQRGILAAIAFALLMLLCVGSVAVFNYFQTVKAQEDQRKAELKAGTAVAVRETADSVRLTAEVEADEALAGAERAQQSARAAETAQAEAINAEATAQAARDSAEVDRLEAVEAERAAAQAKETAVAQQAQAEIDKALAVEGQQTAQAAQEEAVLAQQTAAAGQATAAAGEATAEASQATAEAQKIAADAAAAQAAQAQADAEAAAEQARQAQTAAEAAASEAKAAKKEAEKAKEAAEKDRASAQATLVAVEVLRNQTERALSAAQTLLNESEQAIVISRYTEVCDFPDLEDASGWISGVAGDSDVMWILTPNTGTSSQSIRWVNGINCTTGIASIPTGGPELTAITYGGGFVWAVDEDSWIYKVDPTTWPIQVSRFLPDLTDDTPLAFIYADNALWLAFRNLDKAIKIDPNTRTTLAQYDTVDFPVRIVFDGQNIWIGSTSNHNQMTKIPSGAVSTEVSALETVQLDHSVWAMTSGGGYIWTGAGGKITRINPASNEKLTFNAGNGRIDAMSYGGSSLWVYDDLSEKVLKIKPDGSLLSSIAVKNEDSSAAMVFDGVHLWIYSVDEVAGGASSYKGIVTKMPTGIYVAGDSPSELLEMGNFIWVANSDSNTVSKMRASTGVQLGQFTVGDFPLHLTQAGNNVWVLNSGDNTVMRLNGENGQVLKTVTIPQPNGRDMAFDGTYIWVIGENFITRIREADGTVVDTQAADIDPFSRIIFANSSMWVLNDQSLIKFGLDVSKSAEYKLPSYPDFSCLICYVKAYDFTYAGGYFWIEVVKHDLSGSKFDQIKVLKLNPQTGPDNSGYSHIEDESDFLDTEFKFFGSSDSGKYEGIAADGRYIWTHNFGFFAPNLSSGTSEFSNTICDSPRYHLYHATSDSVWVACSEDASIQRIINYQSGVSTAVASVMASSAAVLGNDVTAIYLPVVFK